MSAHTPGPWQRVVGKPGASVWVADNDGDQICAMSGSNNDGANARLIAAATDLLDACELAAQWMHDNSEGDEPLRTIRAAIAKAAP